MKNKWLKRGAWILLAGMLCWYFSPGMKELRALPETVEGPLAVSALGIQEKTGVTAVTGRQDQRLNGLSYTYSLFGLLPLKTVTVRSAGEQVRLGGEALGIVLYTEGVQVVGLAGVETATGLASPLSAAGLKKGDTILSVDGAAVNGAADLAKKVASGGETLTLTYSREGKTAAAVVRPAVEKTTGQKKLGAWVRESTSGIGTLSFSSDGQYCALGHPVADIDTGVTLKSSRGFITKAHITEVLKGESGRVGELLGSFSTSDGDALGTIRENGDFGIAGEAKASAFTGGTLLPVAAPGEAYLGDATLYATVAGDKVEAFSCRIIRLKVQSAPAVQGMMIEITDERLLSLSDGIVPGMSGSPVVQNGAIVEVVTHVFVNEPQRGYCVYAQWMAEKLILSAG